MGMFPPDGSQGKDPEQTGGTMSPCELACERFRILQKSWTEANLSIPVEATNPHDLTQDQWEKMDGWIRLLVTPSIAVSRIDSGVAPPMHIKLHMMHDAFESVPAVNRKL